MSRELDPSEERELAREILRYLERHPDAKDTLEGIAHWWLRRQQTNRLLGEVERALSFLVSEGLILQTRRKGSPPYYRLNRQKRREISSVLK